MYFPIIDVLKENFIAKIPSIVTQWLTDNVDPVGSAVVVDTSLSISGAAADAKITGDELNDLKSDLSAEINGNTIIVSETVTANQSTTYNLDTPILKDMPVRVTNTSATKTLSILDKDGNSQSISGSFLNTEIIDFVAPFDIYAIRCYNTTTDMSLQIDYGYNANGEDEAIKSASIIRYLYLETDWEVGSITSDTGVNVDSANLIRTKKAIYIKSGTTVVLPKQRRFKTFKYSKNIVQANTFVATSSWQYESFEISDSGWYRFIYGTDPANASTVDMCREVLIAYGGAVDYFNVIPKYDVKNYMMMGFMKAEVDIEQLGAIHSHQAFCVYNDKYYVIDGSNIYVYSDQFSLENTVPMSLGHGNSFQRGEANYAYASGWDDNKVYVVDLDTLTLAYTIVLPTTGYTTVAVDDTNTLMYIFQRDTRPNTEAFYNFIVYNYATKTILMQKKTNVPFGAMQACDFVDGLIVVANGTGAGGLANGFRVYNTVGDIVGSYTLADFSNLEPEGIAYDKGNNALLISIDYPTYIYKVTQKS